MWHAAITTDMCVLRMALTAAVSPQVLQDAELRKRYDTQGAAGVRDVPILDATAFFNMLFGSDYFNHLIGRLELATAAAAGFGLSRAEMRILQKRRVARLAQRLAAQLAGWVDAKDDAQRCVVVCGSQGHPCVQLLTWHPAFRCAARR